MRILGNPFVAILFVLEAPFIGLAMMWYWWTALIFACFLIALACIAVREGDKHSWFSSTGEAWETTPEKWSKALEHYLANRNQTRGKVDASPFD